MTASRPLVTLLAVVMLAAPVAGHVPSFPGENTAPDRALEVPDAAKSWSFYDELATGQVKYYRFSLSAGERLRVGTFTPGGGLFTPSLVVMSPSLNRSDPAPPGVSVPDGMGAVVVEGTRPEAPDYEPFTPAANYHTADVSRPVDEETTYLVAIYEPANRSGSVGVTIGYREEFSLTEYASVPFDLVAIHRWEGQHPFVVLGPLFMTLLGGVGVLYARGRDRRGPGLVRYGLGVAGLVILGSGVNTAVQMGLALWRSGPTPGALVTAVFVVVPVVAGGWAVWLATRGDATFPLRTRVGLAIAGVAALATWAGFLLGPVVLLAVAVAPSRFLG